MQCIEPRTTASLAYRALLLWESSTDRFLDRVKFANAIQSLSSGEAAPALCITYTNRNGEHPQRQLRGFAVILQGDVYAVFSKLDEGGRVL
jgi:hypothetical protein